MLTAAHGSLGISIKRKLIYIPKDYNNYLSHRIKDNFPRIVKVKIIRLIPVLFYDFYFNVRGKLSEIRYCIRFFNYC